MARSTQPGKGSLCHNSDWEKRKVSLKANITLEDLQLKVERNPTRDNIVDLIIVASGLTSSLLHRRGCPFSSRSMGISCGVASTSPPDDIIGCSFQQRKVEFDRQLDQPFTLHEKELLAGVHTLRHWELSLPSPRSSALLPSSRLVTPRTLSPLTSSDPALKDFTPSRMAFLYYAECLYVPAGFDLKKKVLYEFHDTPTAGP